MLVKPGRIASTEFSLIISGPASGPFSRLNLDMEPLSHPTETQDMKRPRSIDRGLLFGFDPGSTGKFFPLTVQRIR